ncbi:MAG: heat-shock protein Hsp70 [Myxococcales bacterium]|nr:MAG: heat-shock protein Hsp70 [Myxococcales bacterium]
MTRYDVGIDLGTTHTVVAFSPQGASEDARVLPVPQLVSPHETEALALLPSFLYAPPAGESVADPWSEQPWVVGQFARQRGQEVSERLVASAKSWLSHAGVARRDAILPWGADAAETPKISPVEASRRLLSHVARVWLEAFPSQPLSEQSVVLTVPASFDEVARELTVEAAEHAGFAVRLLEEPQAAFYDLISGERREAIVGLLRGERRRAHVLVCDVGGGTTDLTLIEARRGELGELELARVAVGRHLLLGGDNIDLALAQRCEQRLLEGERLDALRFSRLLSACRSAKEQLLGSEPPDAVPIRVARLGSALVGGTLATELSRSEVEELLFSGFLPLVARGEPPPKPRAGLVAFGLPYERDPAISRHIVQFLERHAPEGVDALLLNGGLFHAPRAAERVQQVVSELGGRDVSLLPYPDPDLSVARGAVAYGRSLAGHGLRIGGGTPRGFYVSVDERSARRALCVVPKGAREGERHAAGNGGLWLRVGEPVRLELYTSDTAQHRPGELVALDDDFSALPPVTTQFTQGDGQQKELEVALEGELSAIGTVELSCVEISPPAGESPRRFRLAFELREAPLSAPSSPPAPSQPPPPRLPEALEAIRRVFGEGRTDVHARESKDLPRELERLLGERRAWTLETNRALFDALAEGRNARRRSEDHERVFWMLAGYCLRPGFGAPLDDQRLAQLVPFFESGVSAGAGARSWQQFFIAWRRVVAGLREETQTRLLGLLEPFWAPSELKLKRSKSLKSAEASFEMLELMASLERVPEPRRRALGEWLVERTFRQRDARLWSALGRVGARVPGYASAHHVVAPHVAESWLTHVLSERWSEMPAAAVTAAQLARVTDDRARDVSPSVRAEVVRRLEAVDADPVLVRTVREFVSVVDAERAAWFGEELPLGLRLRGAE